MVALFSFFTGTGFLDLGFENAGYTIKSTNENHQPFAQAYIHSRDVMNLPLPEFGNFDGSIEQLIENPQQLTDYVTLARQTNNIVGFIGGPPCPDFSVGGKNRGRRGDKGRLSAAYVELVLQQEPDFFFFENVKGLWRTKRHRAFYEDLKIQLTDRILHDAYVTTERVINAIEYAVPQDRERIILLGFKRSLLLDLGMYISDKDVSLPLGCFPWLKHTVYDKEHVFKLPWADTNVFEENSELVPNDDIIDELTTEHWFRQNDVETHPNAQHHFVPRGGLPRMQTVKEGDVSRKSYKRLHRWRYSPTAAYGNNEVHLHPYKVRRLSAAEAMAIQSMPATFELPSDMTLTNMFKTIGNGVPYLAARGLALSLLDFMGENENERQLEAIGIELGTGD